MKRVVREVEDRVVDSAGPKVPLYLAPMEGVGEGPFRRTIASIGGFDEACTPFIRVPRQAHVKSLGRAYCSEELAPIPQAAQIMGDDPELMALMAQELVGRGAPRIDLNCGCPSNKVVGKGAGASLLKDPNHLRDVAKAMVEAVDIPVSVKIRSGYDDTGLYKEILHAVAESGAKMITIHPRTRKEGYGPPANWRLIAQAKEALSIRVVGSGDVVAPEDAKRMVEETGCDGVMIGRGALCNPWIFSAIRAHRRGREFSITSKNLVEYVERYYLELQGLEKRLLCEERKYIRQLKQMIRYLFCITPELEKRKETLLRSRTENSKDFFLCLVEAIESVNFS